MMGESVRMEWRRWKELIQLLLLDPLPTTSDTPLCAMKSNRLCQKRQAGDRAPQGGLRRRSKGTWASWWRKQPEAVELQRVSILHSSEPEDNPFKRVRPSIAVHVFPPLQPSRRARQASRQAFAWQRRVAGRVQDAAVCILSCPPILKSRDNGMGSSSAEAGEMYRLKCEAKCSCGSKSCVVVQGSPPLAGACLVASLHLDKAFFICRLAEEHWGPSNSWTPYRKARR